MSVLLGCIADDFTGATDIASFLVASGMRTIQLNGIPKRDLDLSKVDAIVISLKSRTQETRLAIRDSVQALQWLKQLKCEQYYFKYCSTFDSTQEGNIGPVADALLEELGETVSIACPSLPVNGRTMYKGYLFVNDVLLNECGMENHPLTPMTDANIVRVFQSQTDGKVSLIDHTIVSKGADSIREKMEQLSKSCRYIVFDTLNEQDLFAIGHACNEVKLLTGGSGLAIGLADNFEQKGLFTKSINPSELSTVSGEAIVISGSCSKATREQVSVFQESHQSFKVNPLLLNDGSQTYGDVIDWFEENRGNEALLIYATDTPESIKLCQATLGPEKAGELVENCMANVVTELKNRGVRKFIVAGGETSGSVVQALGATSLKVGPTIAPGVPVMQTLSNDAYLLALKSGNFGDKDFFSKALEMMNEINVIEK